MVVFQFNSGHHKKKTQETEQPYQRSNISQPSPRTLLQQQAQKRPRPHPGSVSKSPQFPPFTASDSSFIPPAAKRPVRERARSQELVSDVSSQNIQADSVPIVKQESQDSDSHKDSEQTGASTDSSFSSQPLPASLQLSHTQTSGDTSQLGDTASADSETPVTDTSIKLEPVGDEEDLEITGIEMGDTVAPNWGQDVSGAMGFGSEGADDSLLDQSGNQSGYGKSLCLS